MTTVSELKEYLSKFNDDENITFYFLKNNCLTNCQLEDINSYVWELSLQYRIPMKILKR